MFQIYAQTNCIGKRSFYFLLTGFLYSGLAILVSYFLFPSEVGLVSTFLLSFSLIPAFDFILEKNKKDIYEVKKKPTHANAETALYLLALFIGTFLVYFIIIGYLPLDTSLNVFDKQLEDSILDFRKMDFSGFRHILLHNVVVLYIFFFFSLLYRAGALFVVVWNASIWGAAFGAATHQLDALVPGLAKVFVSITPHLLTEASAYVLASMSGWFLSKALIKYRLFSPEFDRVLQACLYLFMGSIVLIALGALLETTYASRMIHYFF